MTCISQCQASSRSLPPSSATVPLAWQLRYPCVRRPTPDIRALTFHASLYPQEMGFDTECTGGGRIQHKAAEKYLKVRQAIWGTPWPRGSTGADRRRGAPRGGRCTATHRPSGAGTTPRSLNCSARRFLATLSSGATTGTEEDARSHQL